MVEAIGYVEVFVQLGQHALDDVLLGANGSVLIWTLVQLLSMSSLEGKPFKPLIRTPRKTLVFDALI